VIRSFADAETERIYLTGHSRRFGNIARAAARKIEAVDFAVALEDLRNPPGNRLEKLHGDREGYYSIRVNDQYRVCFRWEDKAAWEVELVDYH
jgi:proteic killer suppression protein